MSTNTGTDSFIDEPLDVIWRPLQQYDLEQVRHTSHSHKDLMRMLAKPEVVAVCASLRNDRIIGHCIVSAQSDCLKLEDIGVDEQFRRNKFATNLFNAAIAQTCYDTEGGFESIRCEVCEFNHAAIGWLKSMGFQAVRMTEKYGELDFYTFEKNVYGKTIWEGRE